MTTCNLDEKIYPTATDTPAQIGRSTQIVHRFRFRSQPSALAAASELNGMGLQEVRVEAESASALQKLFGPKAWCGIARTSAMPTEAVISAMIQIATIYGGNYEGWEASTVEGASTLEGECELPMMR